MYQDSPETRRSNLQQWVRERYGTAWGAQAKFAFEFQRAESQVNSLLNGQRNIGPQLARKLEEFFHKPRYAIDSRPEMRAMPTVRLLTLAQAALFLSGEPITGETPRCAIPGPALGDDVFAFAAPDDGALQGPRPDSIHPDDLVVAQLATRAATREIVLALPPDGPQDAPVLRRIVSTGGARVLVSDNQQLPSIPLPPSGAVPLARVRLVLRTVNQQPLQLVVDPVELV